MSWFKHASPGRGRYIGLPQDDPDPQSRERMLDRQRGVFRYLAHDDRQHLMAPIPVPQRLPLRFNYGPDWVVPYLPTLLRALAGTFRAWLARLFAPRAPMDYRALSGNWGESAVVADRYALDSWFADARLQGANPCQLRRVRSNKDLAQRLHLEPARIERVWPGLDLATAVDDGKVFVADYGELGNAFLHGSQRDLRWRDRYLACPVALFAIVDNALRPLAIQYEQLAHGPTRTAYPGSGNDWQLAKLYVQNADVNAGVLGAHLGQVHGSAQAFALATLRQLSPRHPLQLFLQPHLDYSLAVNHAAFGLLRTPGSVFETVYSGSLPVTRNVIRNAFRAREFPALALETDLARRGMSDYPGDYPFADDARLYQPVIRRYVSCFLTNCYVNDSAIVEDFELQAWLAELTAEDGGALAGLPRTFTCIDELRALLEVFLYVAGPLHAALHFGQPHALTVVPAYPAALFCAPPTGDETIGPDRLTRALPPANVASTQVLNNKIADYCHVPFGDFSRYPLGRLPSAQTAIQQLQQDLHAIEQAIHERNRQRPWPYTPLLPSRVPNSVNI